MASVGAASCRPSAVMVVSSSAAWLRRRGSPVFDLTSFADFCRWLATACFLFAADRSPAAYNRCRHQRNWLSFASSTTAPRADPDLNQLLAIACDARLLRLAGNDRLAP